MLPRHSIARGPVAQVALALLPLSAASPKGRPLYIDIRASIPGGARASYRTQSMFRELIEDASGCALSCLEVQSWGTREARTSVPCVAFHIAGRARRSIAYGWASRDYISAGSPSAVCAALLRVAPSCCFAVFWADGLGGASGDSAVAYLKGTCLTWSAWIILDFDYNSR
ncbi:hypothetical protein AcW1_007405 [Taiwanofungus camphoratus]|nr:hypothetical protein AcV5_007871 [Antrodia cinnamomea]KAI0953087.1 hypothetical protein AcW1_007405 [Antrodia cinnamomea]